MDWHVNIKTERQTDLLTTYNDKNTIHILTDSLTKQGTDLVTYRLIDKQAYTQTGIQLNKQSDRHIE